MKLERCLLAGVLFATSAVMCEASYAAPAMSLSSVAGSPTTNITVSGTGFAGGAIVDVYFGTTHFCLTIATGTGAATCTIKVPKDAPPQTHWITAVQRNTATGVKSLLSCAPTGGSSTDAMPPTPATIRMRTR